MLELDATAIAVIINFAILVWLLNRVLYKPILKLIEDRRLFVEETIGDAEKKKADAETLHKEYQQKIRHARLEEQKIIEEAARFADNIRQQGMDKVRKEAEDIRRAAEHEAAQLKAQAIASVKAEFVHLTVRASEKMIGERVDEKMHKDLIMRVMEEAKVS